MLAVVAARLSQRVYPELMSGDPPTSDWAALAADPRRQALWQALSTCFLDTETRPDLPLVAAAMIESAYDSAQLEAIWLHEVVPYCAPNLLAVAGEWGYFEIDPQRMARIMRYQTPLSRLWHRLLARGVADSWHAALQLTAYLRALPSPSVRPYARALHAAGRAYFHLDVPVTMSREAEVDAAALRDAFVQRLRAVYAQQLLANERKSEPQRCQRALQALTPAAPVP